MSTITAVRMKAYEGYEGYGDSFLLFLVAISILVISCFYMFRRSDISTTHACTTASSNNMCASCGKEGGDSLKACVACKMVKYCNRDCQVAHRPQHKKECKIRASEIYDEKLFAEPPPPRDCPICMIPLPNNMNQTSFKSCCGKCICDGCIYAMIMSKRGEELCPFCRTPEVSQGKDDADRAKKLLKAGNGNAEAFNYLAGYYFQGLNGVPQNMEKAHELFLKAGELGCAQAYYNLGYSYSGNGAEVDTKKARHYFELAAMNGRPEARHNLGSFEGKAGNYQRAFKHYMIAARVGDKVSLDKVKEGFMAGLVTKDEYANTLRAYQTRHDEMKSDMRDKAAAYWNYTEYE